MAKKRAPKKAEREHMDRVAQLGCIVCMNLGFPGSPAAIHHIRAGAGGGQRSSHFDVLPLCGAHHQNGGPGVAIHAGQATWEARFGTERELLEQVTAIIDSGWIPPYTAA